MAAQGHKSLHVVMFPWLAFGHIIPFLELSKLIAQKGHRISFVSTPRNIHRLPKLPPNLASSISLVKIPLPKLAELPENAEATMDIHGGLMGHLKKAFDGLETGLARFLDDTRPDWIIYDFAPHWLPTIAARLGISRAFFNIINAWFVAFFGPFDATLEDFTVPPKWVKFETKVAYRPFEANWAIRAGQKDASGFSDFYRSEKVIVGCEAILTRQSYEIGPEWLTLLEELHHRRVIPLGLMPPAVKDDNTDEDDEIWVSIKNWLNDHAKGSVVYVALGSEVTPSQEQLLELAHGLELSEVPFFWVLRKASGSTGSDSMDLPSGYEDRVRGRGIVWKSWAPQLKILSHDSVGGFLTHCGWSSIIEGLMHGHPLITLPFMVDQGLNSRVIVEKELGIEIPRNEQDGSYTRDSVADSVKLVMLGDDGKRFREKAEEMSATLGNTELQSTYIDKFIEFLEDHRSMSIASIA